ERLFANEAGSFRRDNFGLAFFIAGQAVLAGGLGVLLVGRMAGMLSALFPHAFTYGLPDVVSQAGAIFTALALTLAATYGYLYSQFVARRGGNYIYAALATLLWSEWTFLDVLNIDFTAASVALVLS